MNDQLIMTLLFGLTLPILFGAISGVLIKDKPILDGYGVSQTCFTPDCITSASLLLNSMNASTNVCNDSYEYTCGGWKEKHKYLKHDEISEAIQYYEEWKKNVLDWAHPVGDSKIKRDIVNLHKSCLAKGNNRNLISMANKLLELNVFPMLREDWDPDTFNLERTLSSMLQIGAKTFFSVDTKSIDSSTKILSINTHETLTSFYRIEDDKKFKSYIKLLIETLRSAVCGTRNSSSINDTDIEAVVAFEKELFEIAFKIELWELRNLDNTTAVKTVGYLKAVSGSEFHWKLFFENLVSGTGVIITEGTLVQYKHGFIENLVNLLKKYSNAPNVIANYLGVSMLRSFNGKVKSKKYVEKEGSSIRMKECHTIEYNFYSNLISREFIDKSYPSIKPARTTALQIYEIVKQAFVSILNENTWMTAKDKSQMINLVNELPLNLGYDELLTDTELEDYYEGVTVTSKDFFNNFWSLMKNKKIKMFSQLKSTDIGQNDVHFPNANNYAIQFPLYLLKKPFIHTGSLASVNLGKIGTIFAFQIAKIIINSHTLFENENDVSKRTDCFKKIYNEMVWSDRHLDLIAEHTALRIVHKALSKIGRDARNLPGFNKTPEQYLFLGYLNDLCAEDNNAVAPLGNFNVKLRLKALLDNSPDFNKAFNCGPIAPQCQMF